MEVFVYKTNIANRRLANVVCKHLELSGLARRCTVDTADCDKVLRVESALGATADQIAIAVRALGFSADELPD